MKTLPIYLAILFFVTTVMAGLPPTSLKGQEGTKATTFNFEVPNKQATKTSTGGLIETGNTNLIENPGFEHSTFSTGWTLTAGSSASESSVVISGKKSYKATLSAQTLELYQVSTTHAAQFNGTVPGIASCRVKTSLSGIYVCSRLNGSTQLNNCAEVTAGAGWVNGRAPFPLGATSSGVAVVSGTMSSGVVTPGNVTGDVYIDDCFVGVSKDFDEYPAIKLGQSYTPTFTGFGTVSSVDVTYDLNGNILTVRGRFLSGTSTATEAQMTLPTINGSQAVVAGLPYHPATTIRAGGAIIPSTGDNSLHILSTNGLGYVRFGLNSGGLAATSPANGNSIVSSGQQMAFNFSVPIAGYAATVNTYSDQCQSDIGCANEYSARVTSAGVVTTENGVDWINGSCTVSATGYILCPVNSGVFTVAPSCTATIEASGNDRCVNVDQATTSTVDVRTFTCSTGTANSQAFNVECRKQGADYKARRNNVAIIKRPPTYWYYDTGAGHGSTRNKIRQISTPRAQVGTGATCANDATNGFSCVANNTADYCVTYCDVGGTTNQFGLSVNTTLYTTSIGSLAYSDGMRGNVITSAANLPSCISRCFALTAGDIVRPHTDGTPNSTSNAVNFSITQGKENY